MPLNIQNISKNLDDLDYKQMPHNIEAEQQLLGALLINNDLIDRISNFLKPEHFYESVHAVNRLDAIETAKARNPKARLIAANPDLSQ